MADSEIRSYNDLERFHLVKRKIEISFIKKTFQKILPESSLPFHMKNLRKHVSMETKKVIPRKMLKTEYDHFVLAQKISFDFFYKIISPKF